MKEHKLTINLLAPRLRAKEQHNNNLGTAGENLGTAGELLPSPSPLPAAT